LGSNGECDLLLVVSWLPLYFANSAPLFSPQAVTGRCFGDKDFRGGLENGILLCELLSSIKPGLVKKINRLPTPIAGLDNLSVFLCGCEELGLKGSQLFDPGDLQDTSTRPTATGSDCSRRIKNVVITIYWLGRAANGCASYNGPTLDLKEFEGLLSQMRKEAEEEAESPVRSVRDSGYVDCWDSERSDSLSPPRHGREDSFDSLDSFGSRSRQTPSPDVPSDGPAHRKTPDVRKDDMLARRTSVSEPRTAVPFNQYLPNRSNQSGYVPAPLRKRTADKEEGARKSWSTATSPVGGDGPFRSVSMMDMRGEEEAALQPHSQVRHELMHDQYNRMKEDDDHWQDDLARWKNRRKSISQDLIKKEEERKMMEQLMTGGTCTSQRRRSIKTYREIVEEKERREGELRDAYRRARTQEEASLILQRYAQRFSISETALERLQLPKLLDRSVSADPSYLRQQSAPAPKFTSTLEARIEEFPSGPPHQRPQIRSRSSEPPSNRALSPKPLPLLTPKPYFQPTAGEPRPSQAAGLLRVNGDAGSDDAARASRGRESPPDFPQASPSKSPSSAAPPPTRRPLLSTAGANPVSTEEARGGSEATAKDVPGGRVLLIQHSTPPGRPTSLPSVSVPVLPQARRGDRWSWDPDGERMRQERWQQEQERMLQEKYRREQEKLKEEWEKAQREVAAEERKYHEEERRILEETVAPLTPRPSALPSPGLGGVSCAPEPRDPVVRSLADWEPSFGGSRPSWIGAAAAASRRRSVTLCRTDRNVPPRRHRSKERRQRAATSPTGPQETGDVGLLTLTHEKVIPVTWFSVPPPSCRSVSGKKLCSSCGQPLGKGAAMIIETLGLYFHIHCFKCGVCHGQLGDTTTGTDVRIRNGLLNCHQCYIRSRSAGQPTTL
uniref:LIM and calponin homology domains 1 n=1 Tax=Gasterosteus aculeatus aculeatus TaxID=481459 RepID=A0AAQ4RV82_GASAC